MRILAFTWFENSWKDMARALVRMGHEVLRCSIPLKNYEEDAVFMERLEQLVLEKDCDLIFSFDFFPVIAWTAEKIKKKYISWVYDCPHTTLYSPAARGEYSYIYVFDYAQYLELLPLQIPHLYHLPLAVDVNRLDALLGSMEHVVYEDDISFVGSLYENNAYDQIRYLPDYLRGYLEGVMSAQEKIYGYNFVEELLTDDKLEELKRYVSLDMNPAYAITEKHLYANIVNSKIASKERIHLLNALAERFSLSLYSNSDAKKVPKAKYKGIVSYEEKMPQVFRKSKINVNITVRTMQTGMSLRALDVLGAGGFLLSNYQRELAENFEDGVDLVLFGSEAELLEKAAYYLEHEDERKAIALRGKQKVTEKFSYMSQVKKMFGEII